MNAKIILALAVLALDLLVALALCSDNSAHGPYSGTSLVQYSKARATSNNSVYCCDPRWRFPPSMSVINIYQGRIKYY